MKMDHNVLPYDHTHTHAYTYIRCGHINIAHIVKLYRRRCSPHQPLQVVYNNSIEISLRFISRFENAEYFMPALHTNYIDRYICNEVLALVA